MRYNPRIVKPPTTHCPACGQTLPKHDVLRVDLNTNVITCNGIALRLPARHAELLYVLSRAFPSVVARERLEEKIWGANRDISVKLLDTVICMTRQFAEAVGYGIANERSIGYRLYKQASK